MGRIRVRKAFRDGSRHRHRWNRSNLGDPTFHQEPSELASIPNDVSVHHANKRGVGSHAGRAITMVRLPAGADDGVDDRPLEQPAD